MILPILIHPDPVLRQKAEAVSVFDGELHALLKDMQDTMMASSGIGLAAPQVGVLKRVIVVAYKNRRLSLINPEIILCEGTAVSPEGCLSLPNFNTEVSRFFNIVVKARNKLGRWIKIKEKDMVARIIQHEIDHLNGILILDHQSKKESEDIS